MSGTGVWNQIDNRMPLAMAGGDLEGLGYAQIATSFSGDGIYIWINGDWHKIDGGVATEMITGNFLGTADGNSNQTDIAASFPENGTYIWAAPTGWNKLDTRAATALTSGNFQGGDTSEIAASFSDGSPGTFILQNGSWTNINSGAATVMATGNFYGGSSANLVASFQNFNNLPGSQGTYIWSSNGNWTKIDGFVAPTEIVTGNFLGTAEGNSNQTDFAAYFPNWGLYIWAATTGWTKLDIGQPFGLAAVDLTGSGQDELLAYYALGREIIRAGMWEWHHQNGGWQDTFYDQIGLQNGSAFSVFPAHTQRAFFATGNFQGGSIVDAAVGFAGTDGVWLDPPDTMSAADLIAAADTTATHVADSAPASTTTTTASLTFTPSNTSSVSQPDAAHAGNDLTSSSVLSHGSAGQNFVFTETAASLQNGGQVHNFVFAAAPEAAPAMGGAMPAPATSTITDFHPGIDKFDLSAVAGLNTTHQSVDVHFIQGQTAPDTVAPHTIDVVSNGGNTTLYANAGDVAETISSGHADIMINLKAVAALAMTDFVLHA